MDQIKLKGITTNNLKELNIDIPKNSITVIYGKSGAGKSSLAFNTLYKLCRDEFEAIESGFSEMADYQLSSYEGILPAVAISQHNTNTNPRSTLYSYLKIPQVLTSLYQEKTLTLPYKLLKLNTPIN
ncbi:MAG: ATP-binding cassette domain-containing protein, partial [Psychrobacter sp.]